MPTIPPAIDRISGTEQLKAITDLITEAEIKLADYIANIAISAQPEIIELLRSEGLDERGRFGGSSANATANGFVRIAKRLANQAEGTAKLSRALYLYWTKNVKTPVEAAQASRSRKPKLTV